MKNFGKVKKLAVLVIILIMFFAIMLFILSRRWDPLIDPHISMDSLEKLQDVLSDDFYFFEFDTQKIQLGGYSAMTNTQSSRRRQSGDFEYIGYDIGFTMYPITGNYNGFFSATAILGETLDGLVDEIKNNTDPNVTNDVLIICDVECIFIYQPNARSMLLYFMLDKVRYCFEMTFASISEQDAVFLEICESAIQTKYKAK